MPARQHGERESLLSLRLDTASATILVWMARAGRDVSLSDEAHAYFADRYARMARRHRIAGRVGKAERCDRKAREHGYRGDPEPPFAAAMGMPRPRRWVVTDARGRVASPPDDAA